MHKPFLTSYLSYRIDWGNINLFSPLRILFEYEGFASNIIGPENVDSDGMIVVRNPERVRLSSFMRGERTFVQYLIPSKEPHLKEEMPFPNHSLTG